MKTTKKIIAVLLMTVIMIVAFAACARLGSDQKKEYEEPTDLRFNVTATTIELIDDYTELCANGEVLEYRLENGDWQDSPLFEGLNPNTTYKIYIRVKGNDNYKASKEHEQEATTLKLSQNAPNVTYEQAEKTITVQAAENLEYSFDGGATYSAENKHTYTENGDKIINVRYKETEDKYSGEAQVIKVKITDFYGGTGEENNPYLILTEAHFIALKDGVSSDSYIKLMNDLDFTSKTFSPAKIGGCVFDGNNHKIENINFENETDLNDVGVFANVGTVKNLTLNNVNVNYTCIDNSARPNIAILAGRAVNVENCKVNGEININNDKSYGDMKIGGLVGSITVNRSGKNRFNITNSFADVKIKYDSQDGSDARINVGGLLGYYINAIGDAKDSFVTISKCGANVDIELSGLTSTGYAAGLVGSNIMGKVENCYVTGQLNTSGRSGSMIIGGLISQKAVRNSSDNDRYGNASIESCYVAMDIYADNTNQDIRMGGISSLMQAFADQNVMNCFFAGSLLVSQGSKSAFMDSFATSVLTKYSQENCYHSDNLVAPVETQNTIAVSQETMKTVVWQRDTLNFSADVWNFVDGQYPTLK